MSSLPVYKGQAHSFVGGKFEMLNESLYREIAGKWHGGQRSALYAFASTGTIQPSLAIEIVECMAMHTGEPKKELLRLGCFYAAVGPAITADNVGYYHEFWHRIARNADGSPVRCLVNGKVKLWKTRPNEFRLRVKYGHGMWLSESYDLRGCFYLTHRNAAGWTVAP
jgi:hypothetical protein